MNALDVRTVLSSYVISNAICAIVMVSLWLQDRKRSAGLGFWLADFVMQFFAVLLIVLRGLVPDFLSIVVGSTLVIGGTLLLYIGLERYVGKTRSQRHNYFLLAAFIFVHTYFAFVQPSLLARNLNVTLGLLAFCSQSAWLMLRRVDAEMRPATRAVGLTFAVYSLVSLARIFIDLAVPPGSDLFKLGLYDTLVILTYQMLFIGLTFALFLMVNRRLFVALDGDIRERKRAEEALHRLSTRQQALLVAVPDIIMQVDSNKVYAWANQAGVEFFGEDVLGHEAAFYFEGEQDTYAVVQPIFNGDENVIYVESWQRRKDGEKRLLAWWCRVLKDGGGNVTGTLSSGRDVTELRQQEAQILIAQAESQRLLTEADQSRRALLSMLEDQQKDEAELRESNRRLSTLGLVGMALAERFELQFVYRTAFEHVSQFVDCPCFGISLYDQSKQTLSAEYMCCDGEALDTTRFPPLMFDKDQPLKGRARAILSQQPEIVTDMPAASSEGTVIVGAPGDDRVARSALYVPMVARGQIIGLLEVQSYHEQAYGDAEIVLLRPVANQVGLAIENARLFAELHAERNLLAQRIEERTAQLQTANKELEAFSYSVSHDLRAPLRALDGFSAALLSHYSQQLDAQGRHYLDRIQEASRRMGRLIDDLLNLSRVTRRDLTSRQVDLRLLAQEVAAELQGRDPGRHVELVMDAEMVVNGDAHLLRIVLENLLGNAWKFTLPRSQARIEVGMTDRAGERIYFVRDNGVGFDMAYVDKLFTPFQRLHTSQEFPGTGIGLATVQRIIARHGGRIWTEAAVDQGAAFFFTLGGSNE